MGSRAMAWQQSFERQRRAVTHWVVCEHAVIPAANRKIAEGVIADLRCEAEHEIVTLNLLPINLGPLFDHHHHYGYAHSCNRLEEFKPEDPEVFGVILRDQEGAAHPDPLADLAERALASSRCRP